MSPQGGYKIAFHSLTLAFGFSRNIWTEGLSVGLTQSQHTLACKNNQYLTNMNSQIQIVTCCLKVEGELIPGLLSCQWPGDKVGCFYNTNRGPIEDCRHDYED